MIAATGANDVRFGAVGQNDPLDDSKPKEPSIDIGPFVQRFQMLKLEAMSKWYQRWRDLSRYINPKRGFFEGYVPNYNAQIDYRLIIDDNPAAYARVLAAGMQSGLTSPSLPWFKSGVGNPEIEAMDDVKLWLATVDKVMFDIFSRSNFYDCTHQTYEELGLFGTGSFGIFEDFESVIRCRSHTIGEYYLSIDAKGRVNGFARQFWMTADQMVNEYGWKNVSMMVQAAYRAQNRDQFFLVTTLCEENTTRIEGNATFRGMKYRSITWETQVAATQKQSLKVSGYHEFPYMCPRWDTTTTADVYGVGPGWYALGNIKMLYRMQKDSLLAINKVADPPVQLDASVEGPANMLPGGITRTSSTTPNGGVRPSYQVSPDINAIEGKIEKTDKKIASRFYADLFMMMINSQDSQKTAREIVERHEEKLFMLGPVIGRVKSDMLDPAYSRTFAIAMRAGLIPPAPKIIQGMMLTPQYISILAQAQKMVGTAAIEQEMSFVGAIIGSFPDAKDVINADEAIREHADMVGAPPKMMRSREEVDAIRAARAQQAAAAQAQEASLQAVQAAKTLSDTPVGGGNALSHILGVGGEQPGVGEPVPGGTA